MRAVFVETGRQYPAVDREQQGFWQALFALVFLIPLAPVALWPQDQSFYIAAAGTSLILTAGALINAGLAAEKSGRELGIHMPLETIAAFCIWLALMPSTLGDFAAQPWKTIGLAAAFFITVAAFAKVRKLNISARAFLFALPVGISYAVAGNVTKTVMVPYDLLALTVAYATINFAVMAVVMCLWLTYKSKADLSSGVIEKKLLAAGILSGLSSAVSYMAFVISVCLARNPGYTSALAMLLPAWLLGWHKITRVPDTARWPYAVLLALGAAGIIAAAI
jgi:hypothetical protein